jgi:hypothetical protein
MHPRRKQIERIETHATFAVDSIRAVEDTRYLSPIPFAGIDPPQQRSPTANPISGWLKLSNWPELI